ncbi:MAG: sulfotransferase family 2 domain-containing protein [Parvularculaceae bacterium]|nr:sulfotransferase family 2 domain-containing protein [Parvularculaceae bacterium]
MTVRMRQLPFRAINALPFLPSQRRYNLTISSERKFIWFRVAKVGTRTILHALKNANAPLDAREESHLYLFPNLQRDYFKFAFVRNPWDRLVSCWMNKVVEGNFFNFDEADLQRMREFGNFVDYVAGLNIIRCDRHLALQSSLIDLNNVDFVGRMERFDDDLSVVFQKVGLELSAIDRKNVSAARTSYRDYYDARTVEKAREIYRKDISLFGYEF